MHAAVSGAAARTTFFPALCVVAACALLSSCMSSKHRNPSAEAEAYLAFLRARPGADLRGPAEDAAVSRVKSYLSNLRDPQTRRSTPEVYAHDAFFNDTLKTEIGAANIEKYFDATAANTDEIRVEFLDVARSGDDFYFRWAMDVKFKKIKRGQTHRSIGISHIRFTPEGKILLHQDYWDSTSGFFQHVPVLGAAIRTIKSLL
jgi:hypothetical protein